MVALILPLERGRTAADSGRRASSSKGRAANDLPGPKREFFFAPAQMVKRSKDWGPGGLQERMGQSWASFVEFTDGWLTVVRGTGPDALDRIYKETLEGKIDQTVGNVLSL